MNQQTTLKAVLLMTVLAMLTACGSQKSDEYDFSSRTPVTSTTVQPVGTTVLYCNQKSQDGMTAKLMVYTDASNQVRNDYMKLKFTQIPSSFASGDHIQFFRWQTSSTYQTYIDPTPVQARFETLDGRLITSFSPVIYWGQVSALATSWGINDVNTFFQNVRLVIDVRDPQAEYDVLKIAMYNTSGQNTVNMDMLMPAFAASPNDYAKDSGGVRADNLQNLHPFASYKGSSWTPEQFLNMGSGFCF